MSPEKRAERPNRRRKAVAVLGASAAGIALVVIILLGVAIWAVFFASANDGEAGRPVQIEVAAGASTAQIARTLAQSGVIENANAFRLTARLSGADGRLKVGVYDLSTGMSNKEAINALQAGPKASYVSVTIPEGYVIAQIADRLETQAGIPRDEFLKLARTGAGEFVGKHPYLADVYEGSLEGYLFPKTYRIREGSTPRDVIEMMLRQFDTEMREVDTSASAERGMSLHELVVLASMIERESKLDDERPLVSSVIHNRLVKNMRLEIDATIEYVLPGNRFRLTYRDLRIDSPYNTYRRTGLPPGPISSPGLASLKAAASPADTNYLYYVLTGKDGSHTFTDNKPDFLKAKQKSKEVFGR